MRVITQTYYDETTGWFEENIFDPTGDEGLLYVTLISKQTGEERRGTVCDDGFNTQAARLFCQSMGYRNQEPLWGSHQNFKYISK